MALAVAAGEDWLGRKTRPGHVLYVAAEGLAGMKPRFQAGRVRFGVNEDTLRFDGETFVAGNPESIAGLIRLLKDAKFCPGLIIVDTLARVAVGADENSARDMGQVVEGFETLKYETGATVLVIHHTRKDGLSERGSSALRGAADVMIGCEKAEGDAGPAAQLSCEKMKDDEPFKTFSVSFEKVELPNGKSSLVVKGLLDIRNSLFDHGASVVGLLEQRFAENGATHGELKKAAVEELGLSESTFARTLRELKNTDRVRTKTVDTKQRYFPASVSVNAVSEKCQTQPQAGVMSPPSLGGDTDTSGREEKK